MTGFNWVLIVIIVVLAVLSVGVAVYLLITYQHPEDKNQAWFPKLVVLTGISLALWTVLLFPIDIANRNSCESSGQFLHVRHSEQAAVVHPVYSQCLPGLWGHTLCHLLL